MTPLALKLLLGAGLGALLGYYGQCSSGTCPLTANWKRGALYGAALGLLFHFAAGGGGSYQHPKNVKAIAAADYEAEVTRAGKPVVVDFFATWCGPCKTLAPRLDQLAAEFGDRIKFVSVNLDQAQLTENAARITEFDKIEYDRDFIKHQCNSTIVQGQVVREIGVGGGVPKLALYRIAKFLFLKPAIHEQQAIVERIRVIEHKLSDESVALIKYKQIKQGLMADLLTGKVRVNLNENKVENS